MNAKEAKADAALGTNQGCGICNDSWLREMADALDQACRFGCDTGEPEGASYIHVSDTLAQQMARGLRHISDHLLSLHSDQGAVLSETESVPMFGVWGGDDRTGSWWTRDRQVWHSPHRCIAEAQASFVVGKDNFGQPSIVRQIGDDGRPVPEGQA